MMVVEKFCYIYFVLLIHTRLMTYDKKKSICFCLYINGGYSYLFLNNFFRNYLKCVLNTSEDGVFVFVWRCLVFFKYIFRSIFYNTAASDTSYGWRPGSFRKFARHDLCHNHGYLLDTNHNPSRKSFSHNHGNLLRLGIGVR